MKQCESSSKEIPCKVSSAFLGNSCLSAQFTEQRNTLSSKSEGTFGSYRYDLPPKKQTVGCESQESPHYSRKVLRESSGSYLLKHCVNCWGISSLTALPFFCPWSSCSCFLCKFIDHQRWSDKVSSSEAPSSWSSSPPRIQPPAQEQQVAEGNLLYHSLSLCSLYTLYLLILCSLYTLYLLLSVLCSL